MFNQTIVVNVVLLALLIVITFATQIDAKSVFNEDASPTLAISLEKNDIPAKPSLADLH